MKPYDEYDRAFGCEDIFCFQTFLKIYDDACIMK